ncbi:hypothetical protein D3C76_1127790 [compost metagenome]
MEATWRSSSRPSISSDNDSPPVVADKSAASLAVAGLRSAVSVSPRTLFAAPLAAPVRRLATSPLLRGRLFKRVGSFWPDARDLPESALLGAGAKLFCASMVLANSLKARICNCSCKVTGSSAWVRSCCQ